MGRQVNAQLVDLLRAGATITGTTAILDPEIIDDITGLPYVEEYCTVIMPKVGVICSYCLDSLCFDCRDITTSGNGWAEQWLIDNNVPYTAG